MWFEAYPDNVQSRIDRTPNDGMAEASSGTALRTRLAPSHGVRENEPRNLRIARADGANHSNPV